MAKVRGMTRSLRTFRLTAAAALIAVAFGGVAQAHSRRPVRNADPVVVELYTAQGCATCVKANGVIGDLGVKKSVIPLTFSVDIWDYLGWPDTLSKPEFTSRQRAYAARLKVREIYTPEIVVQGDAEGLATDRDKIEGLILRAQAETRHGPHIRFLHHDSRVRIAGPGANGDVWLVRYDPDPQAVKVKAGDNKGQTVTVRNAVRELIKLGVWRGGLRTYALPKPTEAGLKTVVLVQAANGGRIFAAARG
jgi:hypothetical protein